MEGIADFLDALISGVDLIFFALTVGTVLWSWLVLQPWQHDGYETILLKKTVQLFTLGALGLAACQLLTLMLKAWLIAMTLAISPFPAFTHTLSFQAGLSRFFFTTLLLVYLPASLQKHPDSQRYWAIAGILILPIIISGAWLVHAVGLFTSKMLFMSLTIAHQIGAAAWVGGILHLLNVWRLHKNQYISADKWGVLLKRFSKLGGVAVLLLLLSGLPMAWHYVPNFNGLVGTGYGSLVLVKIMLLSIALGFAALNRQAIRQALYADKPFSLYQRVPFYIEAETFVLITLIFVAASLASQPPALDIPHLTATWQEVVTMFAPRIPRTTSPSEAALLAGEAGRLAILAQTPSQAATAWSDYNHNIAGIFLTAMSFCAMLSYAKLFNWLKFWPLGFIALGCFLLFRSDAESWPLGTEGFWQSTFKNGEILQHRIATLLVLTLGTMELRARLHTSPHHRLAAVFPILAGIGGVILLTHSHVGFQAKTAFLIQIGHILMGVFALILACGRWLELRLDAPYQKIAGFISVFALFQIGLILLFYREPLY